jgi:hypothetical protein
MNILIPHVNVITIDGYIIYKIHSDSFRENDINYACVNYCRLNPECYTIVTNNMICIVNPNMTIVLKDHEVAPDAPKAPEEQDQEQDQEQEQELEHVSVLVATSAPNSTCKTNNRAFDNIKQ